VANGRLSAQYRPSADITPLSALILARKQLDDDTAKTWLLVTFLALSAFIFSGLVLWWASLGFIDSSLFNLGMNQRGGWYLAGIVLSFLLSLLAPLAVVISANRAFRQQYDWITAEMVHGDMALMLVDESYGRMIQEWRETKYYARFTGEVHLGETFTLRLVHFGAYPLQYFRLAQGQREFAVTPVAPLNCWADGIVLGCLTCFSSGCLLWATVFIPLRIIQAYPRSIATRRAALDFFAGKWEQALSEKYSQREGFRRDPLAAASARAGSPPPP
jgi:hypothetical protein